MDELAETREAVAAARREAAAASARLAAACVRFADIRIAADRRAQQDQPAARPGGRGPGPGRARPGEFVADEVSLLLREQPYQARCLIARSRRIRSDLPTVWAAFGAGDLDPEQVRVIDKVARRVAEQATLAAIDTQVVAAAQTRTPKRLATWLLRLVVRLEPFAFEHRHRHALAERRVSVVQGADGIGYVTGEVTAADAAAIDAMLTAAARSLGANDPRTDQQRRADCFADLLLGRLAYDLTDDDTTDPAEDDPTMNDNANDDGNTGDEANVDTDGDPAANGDTDGDPDDGTGGDPNDEAGGDPDDGTGGDPNDETGGHPADEAGGDPNDETGGHPDDETGGDPDDETGGDPDDETGGDASDGRGGGIGAGSDGRGDADPARTGDRSPAGRDGCGGEDRSADDGRAGIDAPAGPGRDAARRATEAQAGADEAASQPDASDDLAADDLDAADLDADGRPIDGLVADGRTRQEPAGEELVDQKPAGDELRAGELAPDHRAGDRRSGGELHANRSAADGRAADGQATDDRAADDRAADDRVDAGPDPAADELAAEELAGEDPAGWLEVEDIDTDTGELLGTHWQRLDAHGEPLDQPPDEHRPSDEHQPSDQAGRPGRAGGGFRPLRLRPTTRTLRIGIVVPLTSLLDLDDTPAELADRSALIPAEHLRQLIADTLTPHPSRHDQILFTRLLTDHHGRLLDTTELGRYPSQRLAQAVTLRAGTCRYPTCQVPADRCDNDHHIPWPDGPTAAANLDPLCRRHHRAKTFAWLASTRDGDDVTWTMPDADRYHCTDEPLPVPVPAPVPLRPPPTGS